MLGVGRVCVKIAGRDAGGECVIVDVLDGKLVLIDGNVRRKKCNVLHLEPTAKTLDIKQGATHEEVKKAFELLSLPVWETKAKQPAARPLKRRGIKGEGSGEKPKKEKKVREAKVVGKNEGKKGSEKDEKKVRVKKPKQKEE